MMIENNNSNNKDYLKNFSVATKLSWLSGYDLWSLRSTIPIATRPTSTTPPREIPPIRLSDGPHGIRKPIHEKDIQNTYPATCFPSACSLACSWNPKLLETSVGRTLQKECLYYNIDVLLGPGINIKRHPYGGRNHEYFSEDPYLTGKLAQSLIYGIQQSSSSSSISSTSTACIDDKNVDNNNNNNDESNTTTTPNVVVGACLKHFALNNQETYRMIIDVVCDERTIRELYLPAFEMCISSDHPSSHCYNNKQKSSNNANDMIADYQPPKMIMGAYNKLNGRYSCENTWLLQKVLRREWNFQNTNGLVVSDWGAINDRIDSIIAGTDLEMPGPSAPTGVFDYEILQTIQEQQQEQQINSNSSNSREELLGTTAVAVATTTTTNNNNNSNDEESGDDCSHQYDNDDNDIAMNESGGEVITNAIDDCAHRVVQFVTELSSSSSPSRYQQQSEELQSYHEKNNTAQSRSMFNHHHQIARSVAQECIVMLQNHDNLLPLVLDEYSKNRSSSTTTIAENDKTRKKQKRIALIGDFGRYSPRLQGMGSAHVTPTKTASIYDALQQQLMMINNDDVSNNSIDIPFARGYDADGCSGTNDQGSNNSNSNNIDSDNDVRCIDQDLIDEAVNIIVDNINIDSNNGSSNSSGSSIDTVLVCIGLPEIMESEGFDRTTMQLPRQHIELVTAITAVHDNVIVVLQHGGVVEIPQSFIIDGEDTRTNINNHNQNRLKKPKCILDAYLLGQAGGDAIIDVVFGSVSPSGKLSETVPIDTLSIPSGRYFPGIKYHEHDTTTTAGSGVPTTTTTTCVVEYREGLDVGYRYFNNKNNNHHDHKNEGEENEITAAPVRYPFGHGLTYTNFDYSNMNVHIVTDELTKKSVRVTFDVQNVGNYSSRRSNCYGKSVKEIMQLYIRPISSGVYRPYHELKEFAKLEFELNQKRSVIFELNERSFAFYDVGVQDWIVENKNYYDDDYNDDDITVGNNTDHVVNVGYEIQLGSSSRDIRLKQTIYFQMGQLASKIAKDTYPPITSTTKTKNFVVDNNIFAKRFLHNSDTTAAATIYNRISSSLLTPSMDSSHAGSTTTKLHVTRNTIMLDSAKNSWLGSILLFVVLRIAQSEIHKGQNNARTKTRELRLIRANVENLPLRGLVLFGSGSITFRVLDFLICLMNGLYWKALITIVSGTRRPKKK